ncbi:MAG TPA: lysylphosphatidylglycerol synthase domain-containing protein [Mycobacteriales bacterium]|nr:lysylphosphatidylglycerol synthase domain-containing protein [Mycobacteriales bacterium]
MTVSRRLDRWRRYLTADHHQLDRRGVLVFVVTGAILAAAATVGLVWAAGPRAVVHEARHATYGWLLLAAAGAAASYVGYLLAYREVARAEGGPRLSASRALAVVVTGFGIVVPRGGFAIDSAELAQHGLSEAEARQRVTNLAVLEYAVLAPATFAAAVVLLVRHTPAQSGLLPSWVIGVPVGTAVTAGLVLWRRRIARRGPVRERLHRGLEAVAATLRMLRRPAGVIAAGGMALYWAGDITTLWACLATFDGSPSVAVLIVGYATGYALTRRSLPLGGAGAVEALLPFALSWVSVHLAAAVLAVVVYRLFNVWLIVGPAAAGLRHLRRRRPVPQRA